MRRKTENVIAAMALMLCLAGLFAAVSDAAAQRGRSTQTPEPAATETPAPSPTPDFSVIPAMPSGATLENGRICWTDASNNEKGFTVSVGFCNQTFNFTVGSDVTCFDLPAEARKSAFPEDCFGAYQFWVSAFNDAGRSFPVVISIPVRKGGPLATPTPVSTMAPPRVGDPLNGGGDGWTLPLLLSTGSLLILIGSASAIMRGRRIT